MPRLYPPPKEDNFRCILKHIIHDWRGLAELLILVKGNAKARLWDKQGCFSHVFFISIPQLSTSNAKTGRVVGKKVKIMRKITTKTISNIVFGFITLCAILAVYIIQLTEWRPLGFAEKAEEINIIIVNLSYSYLSAIIFYFAMNLLPEYYRNKIMREKIYLNLKRIKYLIQQCVRDINLYNFNLNNHILSKNEFIKQFSNKDLTPPCDYLTILKRNNSEINSLINFLLIIQEFLSNEEIHILFQIKDSLFLTTTISPKDYIQNEYGELIEVPNNQEEIAESIYNIYELIKTIKN